MTSGDELTTYEAACNYMNSRLQSDIVKFISCHIDIIAKAEGFLRLQSDELLALLRSEFLIFSSETEMFKAILAWVIDLSLVLI